MSHTIAVIRGDGIGPEIMDATLQVLDGLQLGFTYEFVDAGMVALEKHGECPCRRLKPSGGSASHSRVR